MFGIVSVSHSLPSVGSLEVGSRFGGDTAETTDLSRRKVYSVFCDVMLYNTTSGKGGGRRDLLVCGVHLPK